MRLRLVLAVVVVGMLGWALFGVNWARWILAARILDELRRPGPSSWLRRATPEPTVTPLVLAGGGRHFDADLYRSSAGTPLPLIFVPGAVEQGKDDPRVAPFAKLLARAGFTVVVPNLPSFRTLRVDPENERELGALVDLVVARRDLAPQGRCGLFAVSYAAGISILVALDPARAEHVSCVGAVGGFADLRRTLEFLVTGRTLYRGRPHTVRPDPYGQLVFIRTYESLLTDRHDVEILERMVSRRWSDPSAKLDDLADSLGAQGRLVYDLFEHASPESASALIPRLPDSLMRLMDQLSPGHRDFSPLRARLYLAHARDDGTFPVDEAFRLAALARPHARVRLLVMESLVHVEPQPWRKDFLGFLTSDLPEAARLLSWWYDFLGERRGSLGHV